MLTLISSVIWMAGCRKNSTAQPPSGPSMDTLAGSYACTTISSSSTPLGYTIDTVKDTVVVTISAGSSSVSINGTTFAQDTSAHTYFKFDGPVSNPVSCQNVATFPTNGATIYWLSECQQVSTGSSSATQGVKIR